MCLEILSGAEGIRVLAGVAPRCVATVIHPTRNNLNWKQRRNFSFLRVVRGICSLLSCQVKETRENVRKVPLREAVNALFI